MKLYYAPGASSLCSHIVACEAGFDLELCRVNLRDHTTEEGEDYYGINPKGAVPMLVTDSGDTLSEGLAIVQYLADLKPESGLAPANGSMARYHLQDWLSYIASELHKSHLPLFWGGADAEKTAAKEKIAKCFDVIVGQFAGNYLTGDTFTVADAYLFTVFNWAAKVGIDTSPWPRLQEFQQRAAARPAVRKAMQDEGLLDD